MNKYHYLCPVSLSVLITLAITGQATAHHGTNSQFDQSKSIEVAGVITEIAFINPHSYVYFDVTDENGETRKAHRGSVNSEAYHVVERLSLEDNGMALKREHTEEDPLFWTGALTGEQVLYPADYPWERYACDDRAVE